jgi:hypothetical protein
MACPSLNPRGPAYFYPYWDKTVNPRAIAYKYPEQERKEGNHRRRGGAEGWEMVLPLDPITDAVGESVAGCINLGRLIQKIPKVTQEDLFPRRSEGSTGGIEDVREILEWLRKGRLMEILSRLQGELLKEQTMRESTLTPI